MLDFRCSNVWGSYNGNHVEANVTIQLLVLDVVIDGRAQMA